MREIPLTAIPVTERMPPSHQSVLAYIEDPSVAIHALPCVAWNSGTRDKPTWWSGLPGSYIPLYEKRWTVTHWEPLPPNVGGNRLAPTQE